MDEAGLVKRFLEAEMLLTPQALEALKKQEDPEAATERVLARLREMVDKPPVITDELISRVLSSPEGGGAEQEVEAEPLPELIHKRFKPLAAELEARVEVRLDVTGKSYSEGEIKNFVNLFKNRYERLSGILKQRVDLRDAIPIQELDARDDGEQVRVIGMVANKRETSSGHVMLELDDSSGRVTAWIFKGRRELMQKASEIVVDEVIGVLGILRKGERGVRLVVQDLAWPDIPAPRPLGKAPEPVCAVLISDLHVGSEMFLEDLFNRFVRWLKGEIGNPNQRELASRVKYMVIAGDICDGVGIYPQQEKELLIHDIFKQYSVASQLLEQIPDYITLIITPGNHDACRPAEPQPAIPKDVAEELYNLNAVMVGNPARVLLHGVDFLVYHGRSFDDLVGAIPGLDMRNPVPSMVKMLQKRHLAPIYGGKTALAPEQIDYLVIDEVPDVLHCGHMHVYGCNTYRDVIAVNSGTFQAMTSYMKSRGVRPTPGIVPVVDLQTRKVRAIRFAQA